MDEWNDCGTIQQLGDCGPNCHIFIHGECTMQDEIISEIKSRKHEKLAIAFNKSMEKFDEKINR